MYVGEVVPDHFFESPLHFIGEHVEGAFWIICFAVVPNELDVVKHLLDGPVLPPLQLVLHLQQIHGVLHD